MASSKLKPRMPTSTYSTSPAATSAASRNAASSERAPTNAPTLAPTMLAADETALPQLKTATPLAGLRAAAVVSTMANATFVMAPPMAMRLRVTWPMLASGAVRNPATTSVTA